MRLNDLLVMSLRLVSMRAKSESGSAGVFLR